jgi:hypothetical protein
MDKITNNSTGIVLKKMNGKYWLIFFIIISLMTIITVLLVLRPSYIIKNTFKNSIQLSTALNYLTGWYSNVISTDGKTWIDLSGNNNHLIISPSNNQMIFSLNNGVISCIRPPVLPANTNDTGIMSKLSTSKVTPNSYTIFQVSRYKPETVPTEILSLNCDSVNLNGTKSTDGSGYKHILGFYNGYPGCSVIRESNSVVVGTICNEGTPYPQNSKFIQSTSQYLLHRVNGIEKEWFNGVYGDETENRDLDSVKDQLWSPSIAQLNNRLSTINLFFPFEYNELIIYNRKLTTAQIIEVENYLNKKFSIY